MVVLIYLSSHDSLFYLPLTVLTTLFHLSDDPHLFRLIGYVITISISLPTRPTRLTRRKRESSKSKLNHNMWLWYICKKRRNSLPLLIYREIPSIDDHSLCDLRRNPEKYPSIVRKPCPSTLNSMEKITWKFVQRRECDGIPKDLERKEVKGGGAKESKKRRESVRSKAINWWK